MKRTEMIKNKYLIEWLKENYPMIEIGSEIDLCELDYTDFERFAEWLVKKLTIPVVVGRSEQLKCEHEPKRFDRKHTSCNKCGKILKMRP